MNVSTFMTPDPIIIPPSATIGTALRLMDDCGVRHLPVVHEGTLVGVVSDRDLIEVTGWKILGAQGDGRAHDAVETVMNSDVVSVSPDEQVVSAAVEVIVRGIGCVPVVHAGRVVGIVTDMDLLDLYARSCRERRLEGDANPLVVDAMVADPVTASPEATLSQIDDLCHAKGFHHVPVVEDNGELVGIISDRDLRRGMGAGLEGDATARALMTRAITTIDAEARLADAAAVMAREKVSSLPVLADPMGLVTSSDILDIATSVLRVPETTS